MCPNYFKYRPHFEQKPKTSAINGACFNGKNVRYLVSDILPAHKRDERHEAGAFYGLGEFTLVFGAKSGLFSRNYF